MQDKQKTPVIDSNVLPFKDYRVISFTGPADGNPLNLNFDIGIIQKRYVILKSIRVVPYYTDAPNNVDIFLDDGATQTVEVIPPLARVNRIFDTFSSGTTITFKVNGYPVIFTSENILANDLPLDLWLDGINYLIPDKIQSIEFSIFSSIFANLQDEEERRPNVKVVIELYLL